MAFGTPVETLSISNSSRSRFKAVLHGAIRNDDF